MLQSVSQPALPFLQLHQKLVQPPHPAGLPLVPQSAGLLGHLTQQGQNHLLELKRVLRHQAVQAAVAPVADGQLFQPAYVFFQLQRQFQPKTVL